MVTTDTDRALDQSGFTGRKRSHFESLARRRSVVMASRLVAGDEPDAVTLYRDLSAAFDERAPRRSQALLVRATTLAGAYVNRWAPTSPWVLDSVLLADGTKQPGQLVDFATFARALVWTSRGRFRVDVLSAAPSPHAVRAERVSGRTRDTVAAARSLFGDALEVVRLVNASFPTLCEPVFEVSK